MEITNIILLISGAIVFLFGLGAFLNPNLARWINAPGSPTIKAIIAMITGVILIILGFIIQVPL
jgi:hypothetical protein